MKKIILMFGLCFLISSGPAQAAFTEPSMGQYTGAPAFSAQTVKPNIMIVLDNSGSMNERAYEDDYTGLGHSGGEYPVVNRLDDMEGSGAPNVSPNGLADLELGREPVGLRFSGIAIKQETRIISAHIEFVAIRDRSGTANLIIEGEDSDDAIPFTAADPITSRSFITPSVNWDITGAWSQDTHYNSEDITDIVQNIVDRTGWTEGSAMVFRITGTSGRRDARSRDNSSSRMPILHIETEDQGKVYYGYFNPEYFYEYSGGTFKPEYKKEKYSSGTWEVRAFDSVNEELSATTTSLSGADIQAGHWDGNWLNWLCMRRTDVLRKVIVGGLSHTRGSAGKQTVNGEDPEWWAWEAAWNKTMDTTGKMPVGPYHGNFSYSIQDGEFTVDGNGYTIEVQKEPAIEPQDFDDNGELVGVLQRIGDKARWGNTWFNTGGWGENGGTVQNPIDGSPAADLVAGIQDRRCTTSTPLAETLYTVTQYFRQENVQSGLGYPPGSVPAPIAAGGSNDPFFNAAAGEMVPCAKNFVILLTDGGSTRDGSIPNFLMNFDGDTNDGNTCGDCGTDYLDDVAFYARTEDLRDDLDDDQNLKLYTIFAFAQDPVARQLLMDAARNGGFEDRNGNNMPDGDYGSIDPLDRIEWDKDGDNIPDTYFEASDGYALETRLLTAITNILKQAASGTAASVLSTNNQASGNSIQAYFKTLIQDGVDEARWFGYLQSLWVDDWGNLREDSNSNRVLDQLNDTASNSGANVDNIVELFYDEDKDVTKFRRYNTHYMYNKDYSGDGSCESPFDCSVAFETLPLDDLLPIFEAGQRLADKTDTRTIYTYLDKNENSVVDSNEFIEFTAANKTPITPYLGVRDGSTWGDGGVKLGSSLPDRVDNLITWTRGTDVQGLRNRTLAGTTWRLGDIISSTPMMVGLPQEFYHELYSDLEYLDFIRYGRERETVVYAGANDGMLHAFTSWKNIKNEDGKLEYEKPAAAGANEKIGDEIWSYIPQAVLPHLKWNAMVDYTHTYHVDGPVRVFDAKILPDGTHSASGYDDDNSNPDYGTFLVFGLGMGGKQITVNEDFGTGVTQRTFSPSYVMLDVTNPRKPRLMWERTYEGLGMTMSSPSPVHIGSRDGSGSWFLVFGSGPTDYDGLSNQKGHLFVVDMATGEPITNGSNDWIAESSHNSYFNEPLALDLFISHNADTIFMANNYLSGGEWESDIWKIAVPCNEAQKKCAWSVDNDGNPPNVFDDALEYEDDPTQWIVHKDFFHTEAAVTAQLTSTVDPLGNLLLFFGTGRYMSEDDKVDNSRQYLYSVKDPFYNFTKYESNYYHNFGNFLPLDQTDLLNSENIESTKSAVGNYVTGYGPGTLDFETFSKQVREDEDGWYIPLLNPAVGEPAERIITQSSILGGMVLTPTFTPATEICEMGGDTSFMGVYYETGTGYTRQLFDITTIQTKTVQGENAEIIEIRDDDKFKGMPAPKAVFHSGKESGAKISTQVGTGEFVNIQVDPAYYYKSMVAEWWDDPGQKPEFNDTCNW